MLTLAWKPLRPHRLQSQAWRSKARFKALACGRGSGKTELARRFVVRNLPLKKPWPDPIYGYGLPTERQAKRVAWNQLIALIPPDWVKDVNKSEMFIETVFGSKLYVMGMDKPARAEGVQWDGFVIDESCDQHPETFDLTLLPAFSHREAWCWRIGVPKRFGVGAASFKTFFDNKDVDSYMWPSSDILSQAQLKWAQENLDERDFREQYGASWESSSGGIFHAWDTANIQQVTYDPSLPILVGSDFNVDPMAWVLCQQRGIYLDVFDQLFVRNTNTPETLNILFRKYGMHDAGWDFYGDATGQARKSSASASDYVHIKNDKRFKKARVFYPRANPSRVDRFASCNAMFCNARGERRCRVSPRCVDLIRDLEGRSWKAGSREPDDSHPDSGHISDALGYIIHRRFPSTVIAQLTAPQVQY